MTLHSDWTGSWSRDPARPVVPTCHCQGSAETLLLTDSCDEPPGASVKTFESFERLPTVFMAIFIIIISISIMIVIIVIIISSRVIMIMIIIVMETQPVSLLDDGEEEKLRVSDDWTTSLKRLKV